MVLPRFKPPAVADEKTSVRGDVQVRQEGARLVERDESGRIKRVSSAVDPLLKPKQNWRRLLREMTNDGAEPAIRLVELSRGKPFRAELEDGRYSDWEVPTLETQRQAAKDLVEFLNGKAVPQTDLLKAEMQEEDLAQYRALSDEQLREAALPYLERLDKQRRLAEDAEVVPDEVTTEAPEED